MSSHLTVPRIFGWLSAAILLVGCNSPGPVRATLTPSPATAPASQLSPSPAPRPSPTQPTASVFTIHIDTQQAVHAISPLIYGLASASQTALTDLQPGLLSWGGNPSTRYNWQIGHAWNAGREGDYRNGNYGYTGGGSASDAFVADAMSHGIDVRLAVPTLGWVAKNDDSNTCSFPLPAGGCGNGGGSNCDTPQQVADPNLANVPSDVNSVVAWIHHLLDQNHAKIRFIAMDNEPEIWGYTHYDVHPKCTTYDEILNKYLAYASAIHAVAPAAELAGPETCCWVYYWNSAAGPSDKFNHGNADFLPWFLDQLHQHDSASGVRLLNVLDVHYYPEGVYNSDVDPATAAHRLRSTRSLWDASYADESWISLPVDLIPRLHQLVDRWYPGTEIGLSEWNWGAEETMNGALAIADVLGIFGREQLYYAAYWREPPADSFGYEAFKLYTNYDSHGSRFGDQSVWAQTDDADQVGSYAALDSRTGLLYVMLVHKDPQNSLQVSLSIAGFKTRPNAQAYQLAAATGAHIVEAQLQLDPDQPAIELPPYSATLLVLSPN